MLPPSCPEWQLIVKIDLDKQGDEEDRKQLDSVNLLSSSSNCFFCVIKQHLWSHIDLKLIKKNSFGPLILMFILSQHIFLFVVFISHSGVAASFIQGSYTTFLQRLILKTIHVLDSYTSGWVINVYVTLSYLLNSLQYHAWSYNFLYWQHWIF